MREYELMIDEALKKGLSPERYIPTNSSFLYQALGFRCGRGGLEPFHTGNNPLPATIDWHYNWPFNQFVVGERYNFLIIRDEINETDFVYSVSDDHLTVNFVFAVDKLTFGQGWLMDVADFSEYAFMANGVCMIFWNVGGAWNASRGLVDTPTIPLLGTVCNFKGQLVGGNIREAWYDCDETFYVWSKIGYISLTPEDDNESGYRRCPYGGEIYHTRRLSNLVVGYSSKGITFIIPSSNPPTFGFKEMSNVGILNRGAINGSLDRQIYVGSDYAIREVTENGIKLLGYKHLMEQLIGEDIIVSYDRSFDDFYIGNSTKTFLLSSYGMTELLQHPSAVWRRSEDKVHLIPDIVDAASPQIASESVDMGYRGQKTISTIETDAFPCINPYIAVDYAFDLSSWKSSMFTPINNNGIATVPVAGNMFRFKIRFDAIDDDFRIGYIKPRYKMTDMRGIRGIYAPPLRGQRAD